MRRLGRALGLAAATWCLIASSILISGSVASAASPSITGFTPVSGPVGTKVVITGTGFSPKPVKVYFHGVAASSPKVNAAGTQIVAHVPPLASTGVISVVNSEGQGIQSGAPFRVTYGASASPHRVFRGQKFRISGSAFPPSADVLISLDGNRYAEAVTDANGDFTRLSAVPLNLNPGPSHTLGFTCPKFACAPLEFRFSVFSDWPSGRYDPGQSGDNTAEWMVGVSNLNKLNNPTTAIGGGGYLGSVVEGDGLVVAMGSSGGSTPSSHVFAVGDNLKGGWEGQTDGAWSAPAVVSGSMVYAVSSDMLYAFDVHPPSSQCSLFVCNPVWTAVLGDSANPYAPIVADGQVYVAEGGTGILSAFDANGVNNCSGTPTVCHPLWFHALSKIYGPPAIAPASAGGNGDVYVTANDNGNRLVAYHSTGAGDFVGQALPGSSFSGPALKNGRIVISAWNGPTSTASLIALNQSAGQILWQSIGIGGAAPPAPAITNVRAFVANTSGRLFAFKFSACTISPCQPDWRSVQQPAGLGDPPTVSNGAVFVPANTQKNGMDFLYGFDGAGVQGCSGTPRICTPIWSTFGGYAGAGSQVSLFAAEAWTQGGGRLFKFGP